MVELWADQEVGWRDNFLCCPFYDGHTNAEPKGFYLQTSEQRKKCRRIALSLCQEDRMNEGRMRGHKPGHRQAHKDM